MNTDELYQRHSELVDKKFLHGLTDEERVELDRINAALDEVEREFYAPILDALKRAGQVLGIGDSE